MDMGRRYAGGEPGRLLLRRWQPLLAATPVAKNEAATATEVAAYAWWLEQKWPYVYMYARARRLAWTRGFENKSLFFHEIQSLQFFLYFT